MSEAILLARNGWQVRVGGPDDGAAVYDLGRSVATLPLLVRYGVVAPRLADQLVELVRGESKHPSERLLLLEQRDSGRLFGLARILLDGQLGRGGYLKLIALSPGLSGQGLGGLLLSAVETAVERHSPDLFLLVSDFNDGGQRFYKRHGYQHVGALPGFVHPEITELLFWKRLLGAARP